MPELLPPREQIEKLLAFVSANQASDLHLKVGYPPTIRIAGHLRRIESPEFPDSTYIEEMMTVLMPPGKRPQYDATGCVDFAAPAHSGDRFRINAFRSEGEMHAALHRVQSRIPNFEELNLPPIYEKTIMLSHEGLVLISGVTGCGKSSTLAAMLKYINAHRTMHVITIEDPIEYAFLAQKCIISQREIGIDVADYATALRYVVRQDPDCIMIGELRDKDTMLAAIQAAETGHLVLGSIHCSDAEQTFSRILEFFNREDHAFIRSSLANSLRAIMVQRLLPGVKPGTRFPATEVLLCNSLVKEKILHEEDEDIPAILHGCRDEGMHDFTQSLCDLVTQEPRPPRGRVQLCPESRSPPLAAQRHRHGRRGVDHTRAALTRRSCRTRARGAGIGSRLERIGAEDTPPRSSECFTWARAERVGRIASVVRNDYAPLRPLVACSAAAVISQPALRSPWFLGSLNSAARRPGDHRAPAHTRRDWQPHGACRLPRSMGIDPMARQH